MTDIPEPPKSPKSPYSPEYLRITQEGHRRPTSHLGAPALVWHIGVWPKKECDPQDTRIGMKNDDADDKTAADGERYSQAIATYNDRRTKIADAFNGVLKTLQSRGRSIKHKQPELFEVAPADELKQRRPNAGAPERTSIYKHDSIGFTIWWQDGDGEQQTCPLDPGLTYLRVRVQAEAYLDFLTLTLHIDITKPYDTWQPTDLGERRKRITAECRNVTDLCDGRINDLGHHLPERNISDADAKILRTAADYLYADIWAEFERAFGFGNDGLLAALAGETFEVFTEFRGLVLETNAGRPSQPTVAIGGETAAPPAYHDNGLFDNADAVLRAYWPFVRRSVPAADYRQFTASTLIDKRAIYLSALGAPSEFDYHDETSVIEGQPEWESKDVPGDHLPEPPQRDEATPQPIRYLFMVRSGFDGRQLARIVERVNAMGSMRLFALRDHAMIREASTHVRMRGQELDTIIGSWTDKHETARRTFPRREIDPRERDGYYEEIAFISSQAEQRLITISKALDEISEDTIGGLPFRVSRAGLYIDMFHSQVKSLRIERIEKWMPYTEFVDRGLNPTFEFVLAVGRRLEKLRSRLQNAMQAVQTSAIVAQTEATRQVSADLQRVSRGNDRLAYVAGLLAAGQLAAQLTGPAPTGSPDVAATGTATALTTAKGWFDGIVDPVAKAVGDILMPVVAVPAETTRFVVSVGILFVAVLLIVELVRLIVRVWEFRKRLSLLGLAFHVVGVVAISVVTLRFGLTWAASASKAVVTLVPPDATMLTQPVLTVLIAALGAALAGVALLWLGRWTPFRRKLRHMT